jgi:hypothetical protein
VPFSFTIFITIRLSVDYESPLNCGIPFALRMP